MASKMYVSRTPNHNIRLGSQFYSFFNGQLELTNSEHIKMLDDELAKNPILAADISSVADKQAAANMSAHLRSTQLQAFAGGTTSASRPQSADHQALQAVLQAQAAGNDEFVRGQENPEPTRAPETPNKQNK